MFWGNTLSYVAIFILEIQKLESESDMGQSQVMTSPEMAMRARGEK